MPETRRLEASTSTDYVEQLVEHMENGNDNNDPEASGFILKLYQMISNAPDDAVMVRDIRCIEMRMLLDDKSSCYCL
jgi:hypothetical protein